MRGFTSRHSLWSVQQLSCSQPVWDTSWHTPAQRWCRFLNRAGNNRYESICQANRFDRTNRIHVEFDSSVCFQRQKPRHHDQRRENEDTGNPSTFSQFLTYVCKSWDQVLQADMPWLSVFHNPLYWVPAEQVKTTSKPIKYHHCLLTMLSKLVESWLVMIPVQIIAT